MKKCNNCNVEMLEGRLYGKPKFIDMDHEINKFYFDLKTGEKGSILGIGFDKTKRFNLNSCVCPKCGKVELFIDPNDIINN